MCCVGVCEMFYVGSIRHAGVSTLSLVGKRRSGGAWSYLNEKLQFAYSTRKYDYYFRVLSIHYYISIYKT